VEDKREIGGGAMGTQYVLKVGNLYWNEPGSFWSNGQSEATRYSDETVNDAFVRLRNRVAFTDPKTVRLRRRTPR
jgi:hypothetical protein